MKFIHAKSPCCQGRIISYGNRRRQCVVCQKTWRIRQKKRGRNRKRTDKNFVLRYLNREIAPLYTLSRQRQQSEHVLRRRLKISQTAFLQNTSWPVVPNHVPLLVMADAMIISLKKIQYTFYFILLREFNSNKAFVTKPYCQSGGEVASGWREAFNRLRPETKVAVKVIVCDGHRGLISVGQRNNWIIQRCHFHLLSAIQGRRSRWSRSRHQIMGQYIYQLAQIVLTSRKEAAVIRSLQRLKNISTKTGSNILRLVLSGFVSHYEDYRSYLYYPEFCLPTTTNTIESLIGSVRDLCYRAHGFRTLESLTDWIETLLKKKQTVTCNGHLPTKLKS